MKLIDLVPIPVLNAIVRYKLRDSHNFYNFMLANDPETLEHLGERKVIQTFQRAAERIPAYKKLISKAIQHGAVKDIVSLQQFKAVVPVIDKASYIRKANKISDLCVDGTLDQADMIVRSSGFTGEPTTWIRSKQEEQLATTMASFQFDILFEGKSKKTLVLDCFALGSWVSGMDLFRVLSGNYTITTPGLDIEDALGTIKTIGENFQQIVLAGTPTMLMVLIEQGKKVLDWRKYEVKLLTGGEGFSEGWRKQVYKLLGKKRKKGKHGAYSVFGASDLGVTGVSETDFSIEIRRYAEKNKRFCKEVFGTSDPPMLFQYDPTTYFVETNDQGEMIFTTCREEALMPLIRYNIHDLGGIISHNDMNRFIRKYHTGLDIELPLPFLYVQGRSDGGIQFCASEISPLMIQNLAYHNPYLKNNLTGHFKMFVDDGPNKQPRCNFHFQFKKGKNKNNAKLQEQDVSVIIEDTLYTLNEDFRSNIKMLRKHRKGKTLFQVRLFTFEKYPYQDDELKAHYTLKK